MEDFIRGLPKCEIHMHICGNTEPEMIFKLAQRNNLKVNYNSPEELREAYNFKNLEEFLNLFHEGTSVVRTEEDIYDITNDYFIHAHNDHVVHAELYYSPDEFMESINMSVEDAMNGVIRAMNDAQKNFGISSSIVLCCERHKPEERNTEILKLIGPWKKYISAVGLASAEIPFPPKLFVNHFELSRKEGFKVSTHAGEEGPPDYIYQALDLLKADRIDHGNSAINDPDLMKRLANEKIPCTMCPLSNLRLKVINSLEEHPIKKFLDAGILASINSDDPSFFRGYINDNYIQTQKALNLSRDDIIKIAKNSFISSYLSDEEKQKGIEMIDEYVRTFDEKNT
ncbi:Adenine deaminase [Tritrichomonas foetus]|uniref:Adenosine deaminase n=1 Tax=Tritrichomonas foetus TaxID=1144522 RepID=A0A1J4KKT4_9EUKA|nr:Adenine deaminase [Tritrichomonas foetus]|eukprot:OHT11903.1 Adenine deaminase [Tritrichomonas foetus]